MSKKKSPLAEKNITTETITPEKKSSTLLLKAFLVVLVFVLYGKTVNYEFTLDDDLFYLKHGSVQKGLEGFSEFFEYGSLNKFDGTVGVQPYRPVTLLYFGIQKQYFDNSPGAAHFFNVLLYALVTLILFSLIRKLFNNIHAMWVGLMVLLFVVHPIHTEVVCSVKSVDELLAACFGFAAWYFYLPNEKETKTSISAILLGTCCYFLSLLSKESAIAFVIIIPLSIYMLKEKKWREVLLACIPLGIATLLFLGIRYKVIGSEPAKNSRIVLENILYGANGFAEVTASKMQILYYYIKLLFVPWPLNWDYSYNQIPVANWSSITAIAGLLIYGGLSVLALVQFKKQPVLSFCILFFFIASSPTNNLFLINGATVGERFLFVPSLGLAIALVWLLIKYLKADAITFTGKSQKSILVVLISISFVFAGMTMSRSNDWESNLLLFEKGVERAPNSSRTQYSLATTYLNKAQEQTDPVERKNYFEKSIAHFSKSLEIYPKNTQAHYNCGFGMALTGDTAGAIYHYRKAIENDSTYLSALNNLGVVYQARKNWDSAEVFYMLAHHTDPLAKNPRKNLADLYFFKGVDLRQHGREEEAMATYRKSVPYNDKNIFLYNELSVIFTNRKNYDSALYYLKIANSMDATSMLILENIAAVSFLNKNYIQAIAFANRALAINANSKKSLGVLADTYRTMGNAAEASKYQDRYNQVK